MENKKVGYMLFGVALLVIAVIFLFNSALKEIVVGECGAEHALTCPMNQTINQQTYVALGVVGLLIIVALILIFSKPDEKIVIQKVKERIKNRKINVSGLDSDDKKVIKILQDEKGAIFQATLMEKLGAGKVKITRLLDKLEAKQFIERKRRGMSNIVVLKKD